MDFTRLSICYTLFQCPSIFHALHTLSMSNNCITVHGLHTTVHHMLHTLIMSSNLTSPFRHSSNVNQLYDRPWISYDYPYATHSYNVHPYFFWHSSKVNQLYDRPWTSYDCPYVTHSANVHPYFMIWTLCKSPCTFLRLLFCPTPCVHMLPPMMVYMQVHHPCNPSVCVVDCSNGVCEENDDADVMSFV
jgi:hypothetical protein